MIEDLEISHTNYQILGCWNKYKFNVAVSLSK